MGNSVVKRTQDVTARILIVPAAVAASVVAAVTRKGPCP